MEGLALDGRSLEHGALVGGDQVEPGRQQRLQGGRQVPGARRAAVAGLLGQVPVQLLEEERVARRPVDHRVDGGGVEDRPQPAHERAAVGVVQRQQQVHPAGGPVRAQVHQLGPGEAQHEHRRVVQGRDPLDQVEQLRTGRVQVVDHQDERAGGGQPGHQPPKRPRCLLAGRAVGQPERDREPLGHAGLQPQADRPRRHVVAGRRRPLRDNLREWPVGR